MSKGFCNGCAHWKWAYCYDDSKFRYCDKFRVYELNKRKALCGGKHHLAVVNFKYEEAGIDPDIQEVINDNFWEML